MEISRYRVLLPMGKQRPGHRQSSGCGAAVCGMISRARVLLLFFPGTAYVTALPFSFSFSFSLLFFFSPPIPHSPPPQSIDAACGESSAFFLLDFCHSNSFRLFSPCRRPCRILVNRLASERETGNGRRGGCCTSGFICGRAWLSQRESEECFRGAGCHRYSTLALPLPCASSPSAEFSVSPFPRLIFSYSNRKE